jgi:DNA-binding response OmpR family regulator
MVKPYSMEKLLDTIKEHLQRQREEERFSEEKVKDLRSHGLPSDDECSA